MNIKKWMFIPRLWPFFCFTFGVLLTRPLITNWPKQLQCHQLSIRFGLFLKCTAVSYMHCPFPCYIFMIVHCLQWLVFYAHCRWFFQLYRDFLQLSVPAPMVPPLRLPLPSVYLFGAFSSFVYVHGCPNTVVTRFFSNVVFLSLVTWQICVSHLIPSHAIIYPYYLNNVGLLFSLKFLWVNEWIFEGWEFASSAGCHRCRCSQLCPLS